MQMNITQKKPVEKPKQNNNNLDNKETNNESDPLTSGITDIGARRLMAFMYTEFMNTQPEKGVYSNMRAACINSEDQNFQFAIKNLGRQNASRLETIMKAVQTNGYGNPEADQFYLRWSAKAAKNKKQNMATPRAKDKKFQESYSEAYREAVEQNDPKNDITGFSYALAQDTLNQFKEEQIELYFTYPGLKSEDIDSMKSQKATAIGLPCLIVAGCTMDKNLAKVGAGEGGVLFSRKFDKTQIVGGYSLSVGYNIDGEFEFEKEILVLADDADGPDDGKLVFELNGKEIEIVTLQDEQAAEQQEEGEKDDEQTDQSKPAGPRTGKPKSGMQQQAPKEQAPEKPQEKVAGKQDQGPRRSLKEAEEPAEASESIKFTVEKSKYGMLAVINGDEQPKEWLKELRETTEGKKLIKNNQKKIQKAIEQNKKLEECLTNIPDESEKENKEKEPEKNK